MDRAILEDREDLKAVFEEMHSWEDPWEDGFRSKVGEPCPYNSITTAVLQRTIWNLVKRNKSDGSVVSWGALDLAHASSSRKKPLHKMPLHTRCQQRVELVHHQDHMEVEPSMEHKRWEHLTAVAGLLQRS